MDEYNNRLVFDYGQLSERKYVFIIYKNWIAVPAAVAAVCIGDDKTPPDYDQKIMKTNIINITAHHHDPSNYSSILRHIVNITKVMVKYYLYYSKINK